MGFKVSNGDQKGWFAAPVQNSKVSTPSNSLNSNQNSSPGNEKDTSNSGTSNSSTSLNTATQSIWNQGDG